jgi:hypothetical protein
MATANCFDNNRCIAFVSRSSKFGEELQQAHALAEVKKKFQAWKNECI